MSKTFEDIVQEALDIRLNEVNKLRLHMITISDDNVKGYLASLLVARLYAFLESGVKDIVNAYIQAHAPAIGNVSTLKPEYISWRYNDKIRSKIKELRGLELMQLDSQVLSLLANEKEPRGIDQREYSTMNAEALKAIYTGCSLVTKLIDDKEAAINQLCGRRHAVAHGRFLNNSTVQDLVDQADRAKELVTELLYDLAIQCVGGHEKLALKL